MNTTDCAAPQGVYRHQHLEQTSWKQFMAFEATILCSYLDCWPMWTCHVKTFLSSSFYKSLTCSCKTFALVTTERPALIKRLWARSVINLDWIWTPESKSTLVPDGAQMVVYGHFIACVSSGAIPFGEHQTQNRWIHLPFPNRWVFPISFTCASLHTERGRHEGSYIFVLAETCKPTHYIINKNFV